MTCVELQESLAGIDDGGTAEQRAHLKSCPECSALVNELLLIASSAAELRESDEPSPRVWNSIEIALRREGLIHAPHADQSLLRNLNRPSSSQGSFWGRWLVPATAVLLLALSVRILHQRQIGQVASNSIPTTSSAIVSDSMIAGLNDDDLLQEIASQSPAMQAQYAENLRHANQYIQDAKSIADANPNDEEARRTLFEAYQQKAMLFELAMDRSLP